MGRRRKVGRKEQRVQGVDYAILTRHARDAKILYDMFIKKVEEDPDDDSLVIWVFGKKGD